MTLDYKTLKERHRNERDGYHINLSLRVHRALSWLDRAEQSVDDQDAQFIFLWIAFNAAYANEFDVHSQLTQQKVFGQFLDRLVGFDKEKQLYNLVWTEFTSSIRILLDNKYVFKPFWDFSNGHISNEEWQDKFVKANLAARAALGGNNASVVLSIIFSRLYTLRNQVLHGGATWNSQINRDQIRDGVHILAKLVPIVISLMMDNPNTLWGDPCYPVVD